MKKIKAIGIDYSLNSPAVCIASGDLSFKNCKFYYISSKKKYIGQFDNITGTEYPEWSDPIERFTKMFIHQFFVCITFICCKLFNNTRHNNIIFYFTIQ